MKTKSHFLVLSIFALALFTSCDPNAIDGTDNYWNSSSLIREQLNGKVKSVTIPDTYGTTVREYNQDGFLTKSTYTTSEFVSTTINNYAKNGELTSTDFSTTGENGTSYSTTYEYQDINKFIPTNHFHLLMEGLVPNLKSASNKWGTSTYTLSGNTLKIIYTSSEASYKDTTTVLFSGKYPTTMTRGTSYRKDMVFASNGMFRSYTEGTTGEGYTSESKYYFKADNTFLLVDSIVQTTVSQNVTTKSSEKNTYDSHKNVISKTSWGSNYEYNYTYDSHNNWTIKTSRYKSAGTEWSTPTTETRTITYW